MYPLAVVVYADDSNGERSRVGTVQTFLPWTGTDTVSPTDVAVVWPIVATPVVTAQGTIPGTSLQSGISGRLTNQLNAASGLPVTWALDGDTLQSISTLAAGAPTKPPPATTPAPPDAAAATFLDSLRAAVGRSQVVALPYADPDLVAVTRAGLGDDLRVSQTLGAEEVSSVLGPRSQVTGDLSWPADGIVDPATVSQLKSAGAKAVLLTDAAAPATRTTDWTPSAAGPLQGTGMSVVAADSTLTALLTNPVGTAGTVVAVQRFLAEVALVTAELPETTRSVVITGPRAGSVDAGFVHQALTDLTNVPWAALTPLSTVRSTAVSGPTRTLTPYPASAQAREVAASQLAMSSDVRTRLDAVSGVLTAPAAQSTPRKPDLTDPYREAQLRSESTAWRVRRQEGAAYTRALLAQTAALQGSVHLVEVGPVTLAARSGRIPVTVANDLTESVTVQLMVTAVPDVRLTVTQPPPVTVGAGQRVSVQVPVESNANGNVQVRLQLLTKDGTPYGSVVPFALQVTGLGAVAELIVGGALVLLAVALVVRLARAVRRGRRPGSPGSARTRIS